MIAFACNCTAEFDTRRRASHRFVDKPLEQKDGRRATPWNSRAVRGADGSGCVNAAGAPTNPKVSMTPSSNRFAVTLDGICVTHPIEPDMLNGQFF
jgi:branched-subunit amino acid aminotransferase/4-amino-4-deoxychorismate lyase